MTVYKPYGYRYGPHEIKMCYIDTTACAATTINTGDMLSVSTTAGAGYLLPAEVGCDYVVGVACETKAPGATTIMVDSSPHAVYEYPANSTVTIAMKDTHADVAGAQEVDVTSPTDKNLYIVDVDTANQTVFVRIVKQAA